MLRRPAALFAIVTTICAAGCGKRGEPRPPVPTIPQAISDLSATQHGTTVVLSWTYPSLTTAGQTLGGIRRMLVYRYVEPLPPSLAGKDPRTLGDVTSGTPDEVALFAQVPPLAAPQFVKLRETVATINPEELGNASVGGRIFFEDHPPIYTPDRRAVRVTYAVVTEAEAQSELSNLAMVIPLDVPRAPRSLSASTTPEAVTLKWERPELTLTGENNPQLVGYNVYRFPADAMPADLGSPVNASPVQELTFRDVPPYGPHRYAVTAVRAVGPPLLQSVTSNAVLVEFADLLPPPVPGGLTALPEESAVRLVWDVVDAPDFAGYKVYRERGSERTLLTTSPIAEATFRDTGVSPNVPYNYYVTSVDQRGNESGPASAVSVIVRR